MHMIKNKILQEAEIQDKFDVFMYWIDALTQLKFCKDVEAVVMLVL